MPEIPEPLLSTTKTLAALAAEFIECGGFVPLDEEIQKALSRHSAADFDRVLGLMPTAIQDLPYTQAIHLAFYTQLEQVCSVLKTPGSNVKHHLVAVAFAARDDTRVWRIRMSSRTCEKVADQMRQYCFIDDGARVKILPRVFAGRELGCLLHGDVHALATFMESDDGTEEALHLVDSACRRAGVDETSPPLPTLKGLHIPGTVGALVMLVSTDSPNPFPLAREEAEAVREPELEEVTLRVTEVKKVMAKAMAKELGIERLWMISTPKNWFQEVDIAQVLARHARVIEQLEVLAIKQTDGRMESLCVHANANPRNVGDKHYDIRVYRKADLKFLGVVEWWPTFREGGEVCFDLLLKFLAGLELVVIDDETQEPGGEPRPGYLV